MLNNCVPAIEYIFDSRGCIKSRKAVPDKLLVDLRTVSCIRFKKITKQLMTIGATSVSITG